MSELTIFDKVRIAIQYSPTFLKRNEIIEEFRKTINTHSLESDTNTPDFILAEYLFDCLITFNIAQCQRIVWFNPTNNSPGIHDFSMGDGICAKCGREKAIAGKECK